jgi:hypothetical protein
MKTLSSLFVLCCLLLGPGAIYAGAPSAQSYTSPDGSLSFDYPADWFLNEQEDGSLFLANDPALDLSVQVMAPGQAGLLILSPAALQGLGLAEIISPKDLLTQLAPALLEEGDELGPVVEVEGAPYPSFQQDIFSPDGDLGLIAVQNPSGESLLIAYQAALGEYAALEPVLDALLLSLKLGEARAAIRQWASSAEATSQFGSDSWAAAQATGAPTEPATCGDQRNAWASSSSRGQDSLTLTYAIPVLAQEIHIHQVYTPGSIVGVELWTSSGQVVPVPDSADPPGNTPCPGVFSLKVEGLTEEGVVGISIHFDQTIGGNWNEIDAVELVGVPLEAVGLAQWASGASATSEYGSGSWSASQATGAPSEPATCGDQTNAWASASSTGQDRLTLTYEVAVVPESLHIHQVYTPGSIILVELLTESGEAIPVPDSADPPGNTPCPGVFSLELGGVTEAKINGVVIHFDQTIGGGWNEIDAVELIGRAE